MSTPMQFEALLNKEVQQFIKDHENDDENAILLKHRDLMGIPAAHIVQQIVCRRKAKMKLPLYYNK